MFLPLRKSALAASYFPELASLTAEPIFVTLISKQLIFYY